MRGRANPQTANGSPSAHYATMDELRFIDRLAATKPMAFAAYAESVRWRTRWDKINSRAVILHVDRLLKESRSGPSCTA